MYIRSEKQMIFFYSDVFSFLIMMLHVTVVIILILIIILISTSINNFKMKTKLKQIEINVLVIIICRVLRWNLLLHSLDIHVPTLFSRTKLPRLWFEFQFFNINEVMVLLCSCARIKYLPEIARKYDFTSTEILRRVVRRGSTQVRNPESEISFTRGPNFTTVDQW